MSIVEQVAPVEVLTETEQRAAEGATEAELRARTLEAAALEIEVRGWHQGKIYGTDGSVCMAGAIAAALGLDGNSSTAYEPAYHVWFGHELDGGLGMKFQAIELTRLPVWNDQPNRTAEEVTARLRSRAAELRSI